MRFRPTDALAHPKVYIDRQAYEDMVFVARATKDEVAWFGEVERRDGEVYVVHRIWVPYQQSHGATVEMEPEMLTRFTEEFIAEFEGTEDEMMRVYNRIRLWGHSHGTMGVSPSGQDKGMVDALCQMVGDTFLALRINHRCEIEVDLASPFGYTIEDVDSFIGLPNPDRKKHWEEVVKERVQRITYKPKHPKPKGHHGGRTPAYGNISRWPSRGVQQPTLQWDPLQRRMVPVEDEDELLLSDGDPTCKHEWAEVQDDDPKAPLIAVCVHCQREEAGDEAQRVLLNQMGQSRDEDENSPMDEAIRKALGDIDF